MREWMKRLIPLALALLTALLCAGCGPSADPESAEAVNIAFVVGIADGESKLDQGIDELAALPALPGTDYAFISIMHRGAWHHCGSLGQRLHRCHDGAHPSRCGGRSGCKAGLL